MSLPSLLRGRLSQLAKTLTPVRTLASTSSQLSERIKILRLISTITSKKFRMATDKPELKIQFLQQSLTDVGKAFLKERKAKEELQKTVDNLRHEIEQTKIEADALMMKKIKYYEDKIAKIQEGLDPTDRARKAGL